MKYQGLSIVPIGGLANRMRVVMSALRLAGDLPVRIRIIWCASNECKAAWGDLFQPFEHPDVQMIDGTYKDTVATKRNLYLPRWMRWGEYDKQIENFAPGKQSMADLMGRYESLYISTCYALGDYDSSKVGMVFRPLQELKDKVKVITKDFTPHTIGVHIRRKDNTEAILHSPLSAFCQRIDAYLKEHDDGKVFLCTDDMAVKNYFRQRYTDRLITNNVKLERKSPMGIKDAVLDLWCLAETSLVLGSYYSSFSDTAAEIGGQPLEIINTNSVI